jgi:putative inorganic carbon (hco3(-)) transporter
MLLLTVGIIIAVVALAMAVKGTEVATWAFAFALYANLPGIATQIYGVPQALAACFAFILLPAVVYELSIRGNRIIVDFTFILMIMFLALMITSSLVAKDFVLARDAIVTFGFEGLLIYFFVINVVRDIGVLRRIVWVLMLTGTLLGGLTIYQDVTQSYTNEFGGLAQRSIEEWDESLTQAEGSGALSGRATWRRADRADGPVDGPNRYAQIMLMLLPLAAFMCWQEASFRRKLMAGATALVIAAGMLLTYSRSAFLALVVLVVIMLVMRYIKMRHVALGLPVILLIAGIAAPGYYERIQSIRGVQGLVSESSSHEADSTTRGRLTEMLAALHVFLDHPIVGVGPNQYIPFYSREYMENPDIAFKDINRNRAAHTLYFQLAAEMGLLGIGLFMSIAILVLYRLLKESRYWMTARPDLAHLQAAFFFSVIAFLCTAMFLHFNFQRYYWFMLALAGAAIQISKIERRRRRAEAQPVIQYNTGLRVLHA